MKQESVDILNLYIVYYNKIVPQQSLDCYFSWKGRLNESLNGFFIS